jgi:hypothetical protein
LVVVVEKAAAAAMMIVFLDLPDEKIAIKHIFKPLSFQFYYKFCLNTV